MSPCMHLVPRTSPEGRVIEKAQVLSHKIAARGLPIQDRSLYLRLRMGDTKRTAPRLPFVTIQEGTVGNL